MEAYHVKADIRMERLITDGPNDEISRNPFNKMVISFNEKILIYQDLFGFSWKQSMRVPNKNIRKLYGLSKIHKNGNHMIPILSNVETPCTKLSEKLSCLFFD